MSTLMQFSLASCALIFGMYIQQITKLYTRILNRRKLCKLLIFLFQLIRLTHVNLRRQKLILFFIVKAT